MRHGNHIYKQPSGERGCKLVKSQDSKIRSAHIGSHCSVYMMQVAATEQAALLEQALVTCQAEAAAQLSAESGRRIQAEEAVEQYISAHYASQAAAQVNGF